MKNCERSGSRSLVWYCDSSALIKLYVQEAESEALREFLVERRMAVSQLGVLETIRGASRLKVEIQPEQFESFHLMTITTDVLLLAAALPPPELRPLDAIHVASALRPGPACEGIVAYDRRMQEAARFAGLAVVSPGLDR